MKREIQELLSVGKYEEALQKAKAMEKRMPYVADVHLNLGMVYQICGQYMRAYEQYSMAYELITGGNSGKSSEKEVEVKKEELLDKIAEGLEIGTKEELLLKKNFLDYMVIQDELQWQIKKPVFHDGTKLIGKEYMDYPELTRMFLGYSGLQSVFRRIVGRAGKNTVNEKTEIQRVSHPCNIFEATVKEESIVPIIMENEEVLAFQIENNQTMEVLYSSPLQYVNYRVPKGHIRITSQEQPFRVGEIVPIAHDEKRKRLVLNIFVDGLSQTALGDNFEKIMPHTYRFFSKGMICNHAYTAGDWTFPSVASIVTGQTMAKHKMLHSKLLRKIDIDTPIVYEYFKNAGYNTTKIGGNWRIAPNYGYARGMNRIYYQHMYEGYSAERVIADVEEQMHRMRETDQFIWMELGELHLIADGVNLAPLQSEFMVWENQALNGKVNSVKQQYDETKRKYYLKQIEYLDRRLSSLYQYIEENYKDEDIIVSLFADHGQGYLVKPDEQFLSDGRTKVAFMFRGNGLSGQAEEVISTCDYPAVMCKLAGIEYDYSDTDAHLPVAFGGIDEREFAITESIHVGDPYQIVLHGRDFWFYLKGKENVTPECRVPLDEYEMKLYDRHGNEINDKEKISYYEEWCLRHIESCVILNE